MDIVSKEARSKNMQNIRSKNTSPELKIRRLVYSMGFRYRLHTKDLPGKPDLVFSKNKKAIFVHGCFWHQHKIGCRMFHKPKSNTAYWLPKLRMNAKRDILTRRKLKKIGWKVLVIWECEVGMYLIDPEKLRVFLSEI